MSNVLIEDKQQQVIALGRLGWSLRRIERETGVRRETAGGYLRAAGMAVRPPGAWGRSAAAKPAIGVTTGSEAKPAIEVTTGSEPVPASPSAPAGSSCEPWRDEVELGLSRGRNAMAIWQDLVASQGFTGNYQSVKRYVRKLRGNHTPEARVVIHRAWGRSPGGLRHRAHGTRSAEWQVSAYAAVRDDPGLQPEMRTLPGLSFQHPGLGGIT